MTTFTTTPEQKIFVFKIAVKMQEEGLSASFIEQAVELASLYEGAYELMKLWFEESEQQEKDEIIADLQEEIDSKRESHNRIYKAAKINFDDLDQNIDQVRLFKQELRGIVDMCGGVGKVAEVSGIPQPSLSRFFSSGSFPRNTTIYRIIEALRTMGGLPQGSWRPPYTISQIRDEIRGVRSDGDDNNHHQ
jgi:DNA-binding phage protein